MFQQPGGNTCFCQHFSFAWTLSSVKKERQHSIPQLGSGEADELVKLAKLVFLQSMQLEVKGQRALAAELQCKAQRDGQRVFGARLGGGGGRGFGRTFFM